MGFAAFAYALVVYLFGLATFLYTIGFVERIPGINTIDSGRVASAGTAITIDVLLVAVFAIQHSVMARQGFKRRWTRYVSPSVERSTYVLATSLALLLIIWQWRPLPTVAWAVHSQGARVLLVSVSAIGWATVFISSMLINHFEMFGLQQAFQRWRGMPASAMSFKTPALYKYTRHPLYLGFVLAFWATPVMTQGHLLFALAATGYIFVGIFFEERDLIAHFGKDYRDYRRRVPMIVPWLPRKGAGRQPR